MTVSLPPDLKLGEVKLKVSDLARSVHFYEEVVGLKLLKQAGRIAELTADGRTALLVLEEIPNALAVPERSASGLYHFAILVPSRKDLGLSLRRLIELKIPFGQADHLVSEALYLSDPDQNGIEIYRDRPRHEWPRDEQGNVMMSTDPIDWEGLLNEAKGSEWNGMSAGTVMGHVHFHVKSLDRSLQFYNEVLVFDLVVDWRKMGALFISAGGYHHHIGLNVWAGANAPTPPANAVGLAYSTIVLPNAAEMEQLLDKLNKAGIEAYKTDGAWLVKDPSDIVLRFVHV